MSNQPVKKNRDTFHGNEVYIFRGKLHSVRLRVDSTRSVPYFACKHKILSSLREVALPVEKCEGSLPVYMHVISKLSADTAL